MPGKFSYLFSKAASKDRAKALERLQLFRDNAMISITVGSQPVELNGGRNLAPTTATAGRTYEKTFFLFVAIGSEDYRACDRLDGDEIEASDRRGIVLTHQRITEILRLEMQSKHDIDLNNHEAWVGGMELVDARKEGRK